MKHSDKLRDQLDLPREMLPVGSGAYITPISEVADPLTLDSFVDDGLRPSKRCSCCGRIAYNWVEIGGWPYHIDPDECIMFSRGGTMYPLLYKYTNIMPSKFKREWGVKVCINQNS